MSLQLRKHRIFISAAEPGADCHGAGLIGGSFKPNCAPILMV